MNEIDDWTGEIHQGNSRDVLRELPADSIHCVVTSPPYYGLRDYGDDTEQIWGGREDCAHDWTHAATLKQGGQNTDDNPPDVGANQTTQDTSLRDDGYESDVCADCGAWRGQLGLEPTVGEYVSHLCTILDEIGRVLRPDGVLWLNLGDTYSTRSYARQSAAEQQIAGGDGDDYRDRDDYSPGGSGKTFNSSLHPDNPPEKCKMLVPHRVAIELIDRGWIVRNDVTWEKTSAMPTSAQDRLWERKEYVFFASPSPHYWFDLDSIREPHAEVSKERRNYADDAEGPYAVQNRGSDVLHPEGKNPGDVWEITPASYSDAHYAVFPEALVERPIKAGCPPVVCGQCDQPYDRAEAGGGWDKTCDCATTQTEPGIALDPFAGRGTTCKVAAEHGRRYVGIDLDPQAIDLAGEFVPGDSQSTLTQYEPGAE